MDLSKVELLSTEVLQSLRDKCSEVLQSRAKLSVRVGAICWFLDRNGEKRFMRVTRINTKTVSGYEADPVTHLQIGRASWKCSAVLLNPVIDKEKEAQALQISARRRAREQAAAAAAVEADKPVEDYGDSW